MLKVHHLNASQSLRILWMLEELGVEYEVQHHFRDPETKLAGDDLKAIHPLGKSPVIEDDGEIIAETGFIVEHILEKHGNGRLTPAEGTPEAKEISYLMHYSGASFMTDVVVAVIARGIENAKVPFFIKPIVKGVGNNLNDYINPRLAIHADLLSQRLGQNDWMVGNQLSVADIMLSFPLQTLTLTPVELQSNLKRYLERIQNREAYKRALSRAKEDENYLDVFTK